MTGYGDTGEEACKTLLGVLVQGVGRAWDHPWDKDTEEERIEVTITHVEDLVCVKEGMGGPSTPLPPPRMAVRPPAPHLQVKQGPAVRPGVLWK